MRPRAVRTALLAAAAGLALLACAPPVPEAAGAAETPRPPLGGPELPGEAVELTSPDGVRVRAFCLVPDGEGPFPALLLNHGGFGGITDAFREAALAWRDLGYVVAASAYRGQGGSEGDREFAAGEVDDTLALLAWLRERPEVDRDRVAIVGYSHGATITLLSLQRSVPVRAAVVFSAITDIPSMIRQGKGRGIIERRGVEFESGDPEQVARRNPLPRAAEVRVPLLMIHGEHDDLVPADQSRSFARAVEEAGGRVEVRVFPELGHGLKSRPEAFDAAARFLARELMPAPEGRGGAGLDLPPGEPYDGIAHGGIYQRMSYTDMEERVETNLNHPLLAGIDFNLTWAEAEPREDEHDWSRIDGALRIWGSAGKRIVVNVVTMVPRGKNPAAGRATPGWVFDKGARKITVVSGARRRPTVVRPVDYPVVWDEVYLREYEGFVAEMARRYDGHPSLDAVQIGVGKLGGLTLVDGKVGRREREEILAFYEANGYSRERYFAAIRRIGEIYLLHFRHTPLRINLSALFDRKDRSKENLAYYDRVAEWAASRGIQLFHQGVTGTARYVEKMENRPLNPILHHHSESVLTGAELVNPVHGTKARNREFMGTIGGNVRNALGLDEAAPETRLSYLNLYMADCRASNPDDPSFDPEWWEAFLTAYRNLRLVKAPPPGC